MRGGNEKRCNDGNGTVQMAEMLIWGQGTVCFLHEHNAFKYYGVVSALLLRQLP